MIAVFTTNFDEFPLVSEERTTVLNAANAAIDEDLLKANETQQTFDDGFQAGFAQGRDDALSERQSDLEGAVQAIVEHLSQFEQEFATMREGLEVDCANLVASAIKKILPTIADDFTTEQLIRFMRDQQNISKLTIKVGSDAADKLKEHPAFQRSSDKVEIQTSREQNPGSATVQWDGGWAMISADQLCEQMFSALNINFSNETRGEV
jgi:flagellar biosynthesis/type III secretory pathway protein FliH